MKKIYFNDFTLDNVSQLPIPAKYLALVLLSILLIAINYGLNLRSDFIEYNRLLNQQMNLKSEFELKQKTANLQAYQKQLQMLNKRFSQMLKRLATENELTALMDDIARAGSETGLAFELFAPQPEEQQGFYLALPIDMIVYGEYHQLAAFLGRLSELNPLVTLHDFEISEKLETPQSSGSEINTTMLQMKITAKIYRYRS